MIARRLVTLLPVVLVLAAGCTNKSAPASLSGTIKYNGQLVTGGSIAFVTAEGTSYPGGIKPDGTFTITDVPEGPMTVTVETDSANRNRKAGPVYGGARGKAMENGPEVDGRKPGPGGSSPVPPGHEDNGGGAYVKIPTKYRDASTSDYKVTVTKGKNSFEIELKD